jgi:hypothetical protein
MLIANRQFQRQRIVKVLHFIHPPSQQEAQGYQHKHKQEFQFLMGEEEAQPELCEEQNPSCPDLLKCVAPASAIPVDQSRKDKLHATGQFTLVHSAKSVWVCYHENVRTSYVV